MLNNYGSILSDTNMIDNTIEQAVEETKETERATINDYVTRSKYIDDMLTKSLDGSTRLIGCPHQLLSHNDRRYGQSKLGRMYGEKILMEAPLVYIKPGVSEFLPGSNSKEREGFINAMNAYIGGDRDAIIDKLNDMGNDTIQYFGVKPDYNGYMNKVNMLCRLLATFLGIQDLRVPWDRTSRLGTYDWRGYRMSSQFNNQTQFSSFFTSGSFFPFIDIGKYLADALIKDYEYIQFYANPNVSYSESYSNSTTSSIIESTVEQLQGLAKELQVVSAMSGADISGVAGSAITSFSEFINKNSKENGAISTMLEKLTGASRQVLNGGNFVLPEIWNNSSSSTSYSFEMHLVTPYGNPLSWYINVGVPMMFSIALVLPVQQSANVVSSPYLIQAFCPGWWNCYMGIVDSVSIEKTDFNKANLPNEVTIRFSLKDLYSQLALPQTTSISDFMSNTGMLNFLMVNAGIDLSQQDLGLKFRVWEDLFKNKFATRIDDLKYRTLMKFKHSATELFKTLK